MKNLKYEYSLKTWGGFYNEYHKAIHKEEEGDHYFSTEVERDEYLKKLKKISGSEISKTLVSNKDEGYHVRDLPTAHRVIRIDGKEYYSSRSGFSSHTLDNMVYMLEHTWTTGFNDYPLGEDFDYDNADIEIVQEWITGSFTFTRTE